MNLIGEKLSPILCEIESTIWESEFYNNTPPNYTDEAFRAATKIFMSALLDKMWQLQLSENIQFDICCSMAERAGNDIRNLVKVYTGIDTHSFYGQNNGCETHYQQA